MARLNDEQKTFIVQELARFLRPSDVVESVKERFGLEIPRQQVWNYLPDSPQVSQRWKDLFHATRAQFIKDTSSIGVSHLAFRLRALEKMLHKTIEKNDYELAADLLSQAAKDVGGIYTKNSFVGEAATAPLSVAVEEAIAQAYGQEELDEATTSIENHED